MHALILSGGGARGVYEAGVVDALLERETFDLVCGTSIGAINGAAVAQDDRDWLRKGWREMASYNVLQLHPAFASWQRLASDVRSGRIVSAVRDLGRLRLTNPAKLMGFLSWTGVRSLLEPHLAVAAIRRPLIVSTTDLSHAASAAFYAFPGEPERAAAFAACQPFAYAITPENYVDAVCASMAIPGAFPPVTIDVPGRGASSFADGCIANNTPIRQAIDAGATAITVVFVQHSGLRRERSGGLSPAQLLFICQDIVDERILELDLKLARATNAAVLHGDAPGKRFVDIRIIGPSVPLRLPALAFNDQTELDRVYDMGFSDGRAALAVA